MVLQRRFRLRAAIGLILSLAFGPPPRVAQAADFEKWNAFCSCNSAVRFSTCRSNRCSLVRRLLILSRWAPITRKPTKQDDSP